MGTQPPVIGVSSEDIVTPLVISIDLKLKKLHNLPTSILKATKCLKSNVAVGVMPSPL